MAHLQNSLDKKIVLTLRKEPWLSTVELADHIKEDRAKVYRHCCRLRDERVLKTKKQPSKRRAFLSPLAGEVMTRENRDRIQRIAGELDGVVRSHAQPRERLTEAQKADIRGGVEAKLRELHVPDARVQDVRERMTKALADCYGSHARAAYSSRPFPISERCWSLCGGERVHARRGLPDPDRTHA